MKLAENYEFWFVVGSQSLYGEDALNTVKRDSKEIVSGLNAQGNLPYPIVFKGVLTTADDITAFMKEANYHNQVAGVITWMHTFSPAKNWIRGTVLLQKPLLHFATQYRNDIPYATIDFDYMNVNQSAHGDREYGYINARLGLQNKVVYGHWADPESATEIAAWQDVAVSYAESFKTRVARFGDNMRDVAVTDGDRVEAQIKLGWTVDYYGIQDLVDVIDNVREDSIDQAMIDLADLYTLAPGENTIEGFQQTVREQIRQYLGIKQFLDSHGYNCFTTNFQDLAGLKQLPGLSAQLLMRDGYGFGAEGDWKTSALSRVIKVMAHNRRTSFMEDYTLDLRPGHEAILGSHMLEVDPSISSDKPRVEVHPLDIGNKSDPARLVFNGDEGAAIDVTLSDFRDGFRLIAYPVQAKKAEQPLPHLPVASQLWTPTAGLKAGATAWIQNGGGHHTVFSFTVTNTQLHDLATMFGIKMVTIGEEPTC